MHMRVSPLDMRGQGNDKPLLILSSRWFYCTLTVIGVTTVTSIVMVMNPLGGRRQVLIRFQQRVRYGCKRVPSRAPNWLES